MTKSVAVPILAMSYAVASVMVYVTFRRYPDHSATAAIQWALFYLVTVVYPIGWTTLHLRALRKLGAQNSRALQRQAWAPVIVGGTSLLIGLSLISPLLR
jgi:hypothetical protein